ETVMSGSAGGRAEQDSPSRRAPRRAADPTAWLGRCRRLSKDYEYLRVCSENAIYLAMAMLLVRRLAKSAR
ncbi:hypothetical protein ACWCPF_45305, partial [Streptomyces sp. NPDC001858]